MSKYKYLVVAVDGKLVGRVTPGTVMVDTKRHESDGWTSWTMHDQADQSMSHMSAIVLGPYHGPHGMEKGTPELATFHRTEATRVAKMATKDRYLQDADVRSAMATLVAELEAIAVEAEAAAST